MKVRFLSLAVALVGVFAFSSSFKKVNQLTAPTAHVLEGVLIVNDNGCSFASVFRIHDFQATGDNVTADVMIAAREVPATLTEASCTSLTFTFNSPLILSGSSFTDGTYVPCAITITSVTFNYGNGTRPGGNFNLIYNSLCSIAHLLTTNASPQAILAHVNNLLRRMAQLAM